MDRLEQLRKLHFDDPLDSFIRFALAKEYETLGDMEKAIEVMENLRLMDDAYVGLYYHLGKMYEAVDNAPKAIEVYNTGIAVAKQQSDFHALSELNNAKLNAEIVD